MTEAQFDACIQLILQGDRSGLRAIYDAYLSYIYRIVLGVVSRKEDAEDITSEFFIKLWQNAASYRKGSGHKGYLAAIARNMSIDFLRKHNREYLESFLPGEGEEETPPSEYDSGVNIEEEVVSDVTLKEALDTLKEPERIVVDMKILSEYTFQEISDILKVPLGTVTWRYREAIKKLRRFGYDERS